MQTGPCSAMSMSPSGMSSVRPQKSLHVPCLNTPSLVHDTEASKEALVPEKQECNRGEYDIQLSPGVCVFMTLMEFTCAITASTSSAVEVLANIVVRGELSNDAVIVSVSSGGL